MKLSLSNNVIEKIENLDSLVHLKELNLSFNRIETIENLDKLINLEKLLLRSNKISQVQGLNTLRNLQVLSLGNNEIADSSHVRKRNILNWRTFDGAFFQVLYLRKFQNLRSLSSQNNPCAEIPEYADYAIAFIPQLVYFQYQLISEGARNIACNKYQ